MYDLITFLIEQYEWSPEQAEEQAKRLAEINHGPELKRKIVIAVEFINWLSTR
jgi:hypothetical protein